jgi:hypothetical protein
MRLLDFADGFTSAAVPTVGALQVVTATSAAPVSITAGGGITPGGYAHETIYIQGSGGPVDITVNPQIVAGTVSGQRLTLIGAHDTNTVKLDDGTGLFMNGSYTMVKHSSVTFEWDSAGSRWQEVSRNDI